MLLIDSIVIFDNFNQFSNFYLYTIHMLNRLLIAPHSSIIKLLSLQGIIKINAYSDCIVSPFS